MPGKGRIVKERKMAPALLRKLQQPLYDTHELEGDAAAPREITFFTREQGRNKTVSGNPKTEADTNMTQPSQLPKPQKFEMRGMRFEYFNLEPDDIANNAPDLVLLYEQSVFRFVFGNSRTWLEVPLSRIPNGPALTGTLASGDTTNATEFAYLHQGEASVKEYYNFLVEGEPTTIRHKENFKVEVEWPNGAITPNTVNDQRVRVYLIGHLFVEL